jgi:hypothetical protein
MGGSADDTGFGGRNSRSADIPSHQRSTTMRIKVNYIAPLLAAAAAGVAIAAAPIAAADTGQSCSGTVCQSPGNVEINDSPPPVQYFPYGGNAFLLGGGGFHGGAHR